MRFQPPNPNPRWANEHTLYLGCSGSGKSQALEQNASVPKAGGNVILWDQAGDHAGFHYTSRDAFLRAVIRGVQAGRGFRIAFAGNATVENYEWWCEVVWSVLDGRRRTWAVVEELAAVCPSSGRATPNAGILLNQGRKFGLVFHGASPKPQEVAKTYYDNCNIKFIGQQNSATLRRRFAEELDLPVETIRNLEPMQFYRSTGTADAPEFLQLAYKKPQGVVWR